MTFWFCWFSHSLKCQATAWKPALGFSKSVRAQPCTSILCHGADQPSPTQIHERGHGPAVASQCKETTGYEWSVASFFKSVFWTCSSFTIASFLSVFMFILGTRKSFDHLISDSKAPKRPDMESGITTPPKMRRVSENDYEIGEFFCTYQSNVWWPVLIDGPVSTWYFGWSYHK